ncbi:MAG TPA: SRPBCC domain-containing protein [Arenicellales bacterium]|nr:SRPBCC domain-containing protein [Arenicellales bacterium]
MRQILTDIEIEAEPVAIWAILMGFPSYPDWNPFIRRIEGPAEEGGRLTVEVQPPDSRARTFHPVVIEYVDNRVLRWLGRLPLPGLFDGEHFFRLEALAPGRARFIHGERFTGLLVPFSKRFLDESVRAGFLEMNQALKSRAEHL